MVEKYQNLKNVSICKKKKVNLAIKKLAIIFFPPDKTLYA